MIRLKFKCVSHYFYYYDFISHSTQERNKLFWGRQPHQCLEDDSIFLETLAFLSLTLQTQQTTWKSSYCHEIILSEHNGNMHLKLCSFHKSVQERHFCSLKNLLKNNILKDFVITKNNFTKTQCWLWFWKLKIH